MKVITTLKTLPLIATLAMGMAMMPATAAADNDKQKRGHDRVYNKHDGGKHHFKRDRGHKKHAYNKHRGHGHKKHGHKHHGQGHGYKHGHKHYANRPHSHGHDHVIVNNHYDRFDDYDRFRLMLGLHLDNLDIFYRDY